MDWSSDLWSSETAHAFILTGVRGVGKTTTAGIIARALNCIGPDGTGGPTIEPCGVCDNCVAIGQDRHVDVLEMDAASRTGIGDVRELIEGRSEEHTSELQSLMRISYAVFCLKKKKENIK